MEIVEIKCKICGVGYPANLDHVCHAELDANSFGIYVEELEHRIRKALKYCKPHTDKMWAAQIGSILLGCDFRDAKQMIEKALDEDNGSH